MTPISIPIPRQLLYWLVVLTIFALLIWLLSDILLPFVAGAALAYFLDPLADRLERLGMSRIAATSAITLLFVAFMLAVLVLVAPLLQDQFVELIEKLPRYLSKMRSFFDRILHSDLAMMLTGGKEVTAETINGAAPNLMSALEKVWSGGIAVISMLSITGCRVPTHPRSAALDVKSMESSPVSSVGRERSALFWQFSTRSR
jgi:predicted PurR-regulated permease PerM